MCVNARWRQYDSNVSMKRQQQSDSSSVYSDSSTVCSDNSSVCSDSSDMRGDSSSKQDGDRDRVLMFVSIDRPIYAI